MPHHIMDIQFFGVIVLFILQLVFSCTGKRCKFQEFRCLDGSKCLMTEKLCDDKFDCDNGEDELASGSKHWNCSKLLLNDENCGDEKLYFKCRYGGCIRRDQVCDHKIDCWGGCDEALDLCGHDGLRHIPDIKITLRNQTRKLPTSTPVPTRQTTAQMLEIQISSEAPTPMSINELPPPPPVIKSVSTTNPPLSSSFKTTESPISQCPPLHEEEGVSIKCRNSRGKLKDCSEAENGTIAIYSCLEHYTQSRNAPVFTRRLCKNGIWTRRNPKWFCSVECGKATKQTSQFIYGGVTSKVGKFPWHVGFYRKDLSKSSQWEYYCAGTLISNKAVLTAAHCVLGKNEKLLYNIRLFFGKFYRNITNNDEYVQERRVKSIVANENYNPISYDSDLALIEIDQPIKMTDRVLPACLPSQHELEAGDVGELAGWGRYEKESYPEELQEATLTVVSTKVCREAHPSLDLLTGSDSFCAGYRNGTSPCDGDSGGGLVSSNSANRWTIYGVVSAGVSRRGGLGCDPNFYAVFTKVMKFRHDWIDPILDSNFSELY